MRLFRGDCLEVLRTLPADSIDTIITDPPYHLTAQSRNGSPRINDPATPFGRTKLGSNGSGGFMGKTWDGGDVAFRPETWAAILRVAKPGAILLAFGGTRTWHRLACAIEDAGWELRDTIMWLYGSGFPKSLDISKAIDKAAGAERRITGRKTYADGTSGHWGVSDKYAQDSHTKSLTGEHAKFDSLAATDSAKLWNGWGTALKPAWEPILVAMKALDGTFAQNAQKHGVAGLNIDGGRIRAADGVPKFTHRAEPSLNCYGDGKNGVITYLTNPA